MAEVELHVRMYPYRSAVPPTASVTAAVLTYVVDSRGEAIAAWWQNARDDEARQLSTATYPLR